MKLFGTTIVILNDMRLAIDLLEKKSMIYSDRVVPEFAAKLQVDISSVGGVILFICSIIRCAYGGSVVYQQYGDCFRTMRKMFHQFMGTRLLVSRYEHLEEIESWRLLYRIKRDPTNFRRHFRTYIQLICYTSGIFVNNLQP